EQKPAKLPVMPQDSNFEFVSHSLEKSFRPLGQEKFTVIGMNEMNSKRRVSPLVNVDAKIIEHFAISVEWAPIRSKYTDVLRREVQDLPKLYLTSPLLRFRTHAFGDIN